MLRLRSEDNNTYIEISLYVLLSWNRLKGKKHTLLARLFSKKKMRHYDHCGDSVVVQSSLSATFKLQKTSVGNHLWCSWKFSAFLASSICMIGETVIDYIIIHLRTCFFESLHRHITTRAFNISLLNDH